MSALLLILLAQAGSPDRLHVDWVAPEGCPDESELTSTLASAVPKDRTFSASVRIDEPRNAERAWRAVVVTKLPGGEERTRVVDGPDCARVTEAAVLVLTIAATTLPPEPKRESTPAVLSPVAESPPLRALEDDDQVKTQPFKLSLRFQPVVGANLGLLPLPGVSVGVAVGFFRDPIRVDVAASTWLESQTPETRRGARFNLVSFLIRGSWLFSPRERLRLGPCVSVEGGPLRAEATRVTMPTRVDTAWLAVFGGATLGFEVSPFVHPWVTLEVGANLIRPSFVITTATEAVVAHRVGLPVGRLTVGVEFFIP